MEVREGMRREIKVIFRDNHNYYIVYIEKGILKSQVYLSKQKELSEKMGESIRAVSVTASTLEEEIGYWLFRLKRYFIKKRRKQSC